MTANAIAVSRRPTTKQDADAALSAMKADIKADLARLEAKANMMIGLLLAMSVIILGGKL